MHIEKTSVDEVTSTQTPTTSENSTKKPVSQLAFALSRAQGMIEAPRRTKTVDFLDNKGRRVNYTYADLADVLAVIRLPLAANELALIHQIESTMQGFELRTTLMHSSGEKIETTYPLPSPLDMGPQAFGGMLSFARRYSVSTLLSIASQQDDDAQEAEEELEEEREPYDPDFDQRPPQDRPKPSGAPAIIRPVDNRKPTGEMLQALFDLANSRGWKKEQVAIYLETHYKVKNSLELNRSQVSELIDTIQKKSYIEANLHKT